jgi:putative glycerol-1-phosphate prenyltransferase
MTKFKGKLFQRNHGNSALWILLDPDRANDALIKVVAACRDDQSVAGILVGSSLQTSSNYDGFVENLRSMSSLPVVLFPGSGMQISAKADGLLLLTLISGRNPEYLIGQHVAYAAALRDSGLDLIPTGYLLIDGGKSTTAHYVTQTLPIPGDKPDIAAMTALAGAQLGLKVIYLDCGSGAHKPVSAAMVAAVRQAVDLPIVVGGGITHAEQILALRQAGADWIVVGNAIEQNPAMLEELTQKLRDTALDFQGPPPAGG